MQALFVGKGFLLARKTKEGFRHIAADARRPQAFGIDAAPHAFHLGEHIFAAHIPQPGSRTQPVEAGYMANAWAMAVHDDYDACCGILDDIGRTLKIYAR